MKQIIAVLTFFSLSGLTFMSQAKDYHVEVLIFENLFPSQTYENNAYQPPNKMVSHAEHWPLAANLLVEEAKKLSDSANYRLITTLAWGQQSLPQSQATAYQVNDNNVSGWIKVYAKQLAFVNLDLDVNGYRISEKRRIKLNQRHFFDHPKFGVLVQVSRLETDETNDDTITDKPLQASK